MSLVINGMKMPKNCNECPMHFYEGQGICSCRVLSAIEDDEVLKPWKKKRKDCPLIEIPSCGRLIDADALREKFPKPQNWMSIAQALIHITGIWAEIDNAPTIIEVEKK